MCGRSHAARDMVNAAVMSAPAAAEHGETDEQPLDERLAG
jgi:hypothetical protein